MSNEHHNHDYLYVATDLSCTLFPRDPALARDLRYNNIIYRRLDGQYFAWLHHQFMGLLNKKDDSGISVDEWTELFDRWDFIEKWAEERVGKEKLDRIVKEFGAKGAKGAKETNAMKEYQAPGKEPRK